MKKFNKILSLVLVLAMVLSMAACGGSSEPAEAPAAAATEAAVTYVDPYADIADDYDELSQAIYDDVLGEFYTVYQEALAETNVSKRQALMAVAEAELLASGVMLPLSTNGGLYAMSRFVNYTNTSTLWGNDSYRFHDRLVVTEPIKSEDRAELKAMWAELKGTGTWEDSAKAFLADKGYELKDSFAFTYPSDPQTWDVLATSLSADSEAIINTYDGLYEYDNENILQPALAESYEVSEDGLTYTFKIKQGLKWVDNQGREVADVKADDFVAGMQHMMDAMGGLEYLVQYIIVGADDYISGNTTDFSTVGVKALDDATLQYTLVAPTSYFMTMLGYGVFAPMSREFYESKGGKFGDEYDAAAASYTYGKTPDDIAYCGPYLVTNATAQNTIVFSANPSYWDAENINLKTITWLFDDQSDPMKAYNDFLAGTIDSVSLTASRLETAKQDGNYDAYSYVSDTDATSFMGFTNLRRVALANYTDDNAAVSPKTEEDVVRSNAAMLNQNFRLALATGVDRAAYNAQVVGEDLKLTSLRNSYTPGNFVAMQEDVTIDINGTETTFPAGTFFGEIVQAQLDADGIVLTAWDPAANGGVGSSDGYDGWYNPDAAAAYMDAAVEELGALGIEVSAENPIYVDLPTWTANENYANRANAYKQSVEAATAGRIIINLVPCNTVQEWYDAGYYPATGAECNYDVADVSGWGPDYGDPQTYLDTMLPQYAGYMTKAIGVF